MKNKSEKIKINAAAIRRCVVLITCLIGLVFFLLSYTTGYYVLGEMNSMRILAAIIIAIILELAELILNRKMNSQVTENIFSLLVTVLSMFALVTLMGDRVEGIGFTIVTQFDAGHGGAEACYLSFVACGSFLVGCLMSIIHSFMPLNK